MMKIDHRIKHKLKCNLCGETVERKNLSKKPVCADCRKRRASEYLQAKIERKLMVYGDVEFEGYEFGNDLDRLGLSLHQEWIINKDKQALKILIKLLLKEYEENE